MIIVGSTEIALMLIGEMEGESHLEEDEEAGDPTDSSEKAGHTVHTGDR